MHYSPRNIIFVHQLLPFHTGTIISGGGHETCPLSAAIQFRIQRRDGQIRWIEHSCQPVQDDQDVLYKVEQVAATDTNVLVLGETGTGKELISRAIHNNSLRKARPLVKVNCATLPSNLIESKLHLADDLARPAHKEMPTPLKSLQAIETDYIVRVLQETNWRIDGAQGAALILDMNPSTLRSRLRKLGIKKP